MRKSMVCGALAVAAMAGGATASAASPYLHKVFDFCPAPGQFVNDVPEYESGFTYADMISAAEENLCGDRTPGMVSLGAFGGYVVVGFDHPVVNVHGRYDFKIFGNTFYNNDGTGGSAEPGIVYVSVDTNGNGLPDDTWYELAGSEFSNPSTRRGVKITYFKPAAGKPADPDPDYSAIVDRTYIRYATSDSSLSEGWLMKNMFHAQSYWPEWIDGETLEFEGTMLPDNSTETGGVYNLMPFAWGYVDNRPNDDFPGLSLDWAVDADGNPVALPHADFIKVQTGICHSNGWLGENSTEVTGGEDLHPDAVYSPEWPSDPINPGTGAVDDISLADFAWISATPEYLHVRSAYGAEMAVYDLTGRMAASFMVDAGDSRIGISWLPKGLYVAVVGGHAYRFVR